MFTIRKKDGTTLFVPTRQDHSRALNVPGRIPALRPLNHPSQFAVSKNGGAESTLTKDYLPYSLEDAELFVEELKGRLEHGLPIRL